MHRIRLPFQPTAKKNALQIWPLSAPERGKNVASLAHFASLRCLEDEGACDKKALTDCLLTRASAADGDVRISALESGPGSAVIEGFKEILVQKGTLEGN